ncbi:arginase [Paenibacillus nasutitermitis]|uniref:Arginase n=1 Tax=Paenibacillus nasutitermitis TaxID=1652958 RepID=A0A917DT81_9BACL|nr:arginase [Paenibacillus nasutitermitis]GGD68739.1 arginase [Paenibacillus nasutitermitis]
MLQKQVAILPVPFDWGASRRGAAGGPQAVILAGLEQKLQQLGLNYSLHREFHLQDPPADRRSSKRMKHWGRVHDMSLAVSGEIARLVSCGYFPLTLGGDHSIAMGTIAGLTEHKQRLGVIWIDAHADLNTPRTSPSGNLHGMSLAAGLGHGDSRFTRLRGFSPKLQPGRIVLVGARQLDEGEKQLIRTLGVTCFTMQDIDRLGMARVMEQTIRIASNGSDGIHVSFDIDCIDPGEAPGTGTPVRGGLSYREAHLAMEMLAETGAVTSADMVEVNPLLDPSSGTARLAVELIGSLLGERIL